MHRPVFAGHEKQYLAECIDSNFVSSVGARVTEFEERLATFVGARYAIATMNGTAALHIALELAGAKPGTEIIGQSLTFIATCNAASYTGATPVFVDVDRDTLGMSPQALRAFLEANAQRRDGGAWNRGTGRQIVACVPMHTFGHPCRIDEIAAICDEWGIVLVEDAAESLGSWYKGRHTGTFGRLGTFSFNGNKIITTGGGGMVVTDDEALARRCKHLTTTAKIPHPYEYVHDEVGYNYRLPNLNAALGCAQMEQLEGFLVHKRALAARYIDFFKDAGVTFVQEPANSRANYWLNAIVLDSLAERDEFLKATNEAGVMTRPIWRLMTHLKMFSGCQHGGLENANWLEERVVNIPSSVPTPWVGR
ncbi:LegC family aminotransferase [Ramlibacter humi]|uniref:GDP-perosamine synthase n=1 Tax=Ramlibacter humi TaxID=2530451 RepID=A0A4Z0BXW3_9BURK|nr:LegC family aminotransferase [Ramlibacter humi]